jgi:hypothetical protein
VRRKQALLRARRLLAAVCCAIFLLTPAAAQTDPPSDHKDHDSQSRLVHHVPPMPASPAEYRPITPDERLEWFTRATVGPKSLAGGLFSAGFGTVTNNPHEYGTSWSGFGKRYGMRLTGVSTGNAIEAGLGAAWGEDPRYHHTVDQPFPARLKNVFDLTFRAYRTDGQRHPAYARYVAIFGNNFLSNSWRAQSEADWQHALLRSGEGFGARFLSDAFNEFVPQVWQHFRHRHEP